MKYLLPLLFFYISTVQSQSSDKNDSINKSTIGFYYGFATQTGIISKYHYYYKPQVYILEFKRTFSTKKFLTLSYRISMEYNEAVFCEFYVTDPCVDSNNTDYGLNFSFDISRALSKKLTAYAFLGVGPHYLKEKLVRQANKFIFSDNLGIGLHYHIYKGINIDTRYVFRHLSNARITKPNFGIENQLLMFGISKGF